MLIIIFNNKNLIILLYIFIINIIKLLNKIISHLFLKNILSFF